MYDPIHARNSWDAVNARMKEDEAVISAGISDDENARAVHLNKVREATEDYGLAYRQQQDILNAWKPRSYNLVDEAAQKASAIALKKVGVADADNMAYQIAKLVNKNKADWTDEDEANAKTYLDALQGDQWHNAGLAFTRNIDKYPNAGYQNKLLAMIPSDELNDHPEYQQLSNLYSMLYTRYHSKSTAAGMALINSTAALSLANTATAGITKLLGENETSKAFQRSMDYMNQLNKTSQADEPLLYGAVNMAGNVGQLLGLSNVFKLGTKAISTGAKLGVKGAENFLTFAGQKAINEAGDLATGKVTGGQYLQDVGVSGLSGVVGTVAAAPVEAVLAKYGMENAFTKFVQNTASDLAFTGGQMGTELALSRNKPTAQDFAVNAGATFLFRAISHGMANIELPAGRQIQAQEAMRKLERAATPEEVRARTAEMRSVIGEHGDSEVAKMLDAMDELAGGAKTSRPTPDAGSLSGTGLFPYPSDAELFSGLALRRRAAGKPWDPESVWQLIQDALNTFRGKPELVPSDAKLFGSVKSVPELLELVKAAMAQAQAGWGNKGLTKGLAEPFDSIGMGAKEKAQLGEVNKGLTNRPGDVHNGDGENGYSGNANEGAGGVGSAVKSAADPLDSADEAANSLKKAAGAEEYTEGAGKVNFDRQKLLNSGNQSDKGGELTKTGRALEKHGSRIGSIYPQATGNVANKNALGNKTLESILNNPNATSVIRYHAMYGNILEIKIPGGMGARFSADGSTFIGFLE